MSKGVGKGYYFKASKGLYHVRVYQDHKYHHVGYYASPERATLAREQFIKDGIKIEADRSPLMTEKVGKPKRVSRKRHAHKAPAMIRNIDIMEPVYSPELANQSMQQILASSKYQVVGRR